MLQLSRRRAGLLLRRSTIRQAHNKTVLEYDKDHDAAREDQSFQLPDGRTIGFAEYGEPRGTPAFFLHGSPGCRYDGMGYTDIAKKLNVRIICPDRPGFGLSTLPSSRKLSEYPKDITALAKHLKIPNYHIFGLSGGGPYAVACAHGSPKNELLNAAVVAGMGPPGIVNVRAAGLYTVLALGTVKWVPGVIRALTNWTIAKDERIEKQLNLVLRILSEEDRKVLDTPKARSLIMKCFKGAYQSGPEGAIRDSLTYGSPWDFELKDVQRSVKLFFGGKDSRTPLAFGQYYKQHLPSAQLYEYDDASHVTLDKYDEEILSSIIGVSEPKRMSRVYK